MFIKMRESKGFTLVELMIVVAIIGILAAVAVPYYQKYIQKSRLTSKVFPAIHSIETNLASYYSFNAAFPTGTIFKTLASDANTKCLKTITPTTTNVTFVVGSSTGTVCDELKALSGTNTGTLVVTPQTVSGKITGWKLSGTLATNLGLASEQ